jgi:hypothetical protein
MVGFLIMEKPTMYNFAMSALAAIFILFGQLVGFDYGDGE